MLFHSNYGPIMYRFPHIAISWKSPNLYTPPVFNVPVKKRISRRGLVLAKQNDWATMCWKKWHVIIIIIIIIIIILYIYIFFYTLGSKDPEG